MPYRTCTPPKEIHRTAPERDIEILLIKYELSKNREIAPFHVVEKKNWEKFSSCDDSGFQILSICFILPFGGAPWHSQTWTYAGIFIKNM